MSQPPFQPPQQPPQPPQQPPNAYNPYNQPTPPQQPPGFGPASHASGQPPVPGQPPMPAPGQPPMQPMYPAPPFQGMPYGHQPNASGHPVGAVFLALFVSLIISMLYSGLILLTYKDQTITVANTMYLGHALINGAVVGALIGAVGHRNHGAWIWGAVIAALGAFFGYTNAFPLVIADAQSPAAIGDMMEADPFIPAKAWWNDEIGGGVDWFSPLGLVLAAVTAWGLAYLIGNRRRQR